MTWESLCLWIFRDVVKLFNLFGIGGALDIIAAPANLRHESIQRLASQRDKQHSFSHHRGDPGEVFKPI